MKQAKATIPDSKPPGINEVVQTLQDLKNDKSACEDGVMTELSKWEVQKLSYL